MQYVFGAAAKMQDLGYAMMQTYINQAIKYLQNPTYVAASGGALLALAIFRCYAWIDTRAFPLTIFARSILCGLRTASL